MVNVASALRAIVGADRVRVDEASRALYSHDLFTFDGPLPLAVVTPDSPERVQALVEFARAADLGIHPRGGGLSYSGGYVPMRERSVIVDMGAMGRVLEVDASGGWLSVEAGANWAVVREALEGSGLRTVYRAPISGSVTTVGGALSQVTVDPLDGILALEVVTGAGELVRTGSAAAGLPPFFRHFGPDMVGIFLGDCGAFGIKTAATLALESEPAAAGHASFALESFSDLVAAGIRVSRSGVASRVLGLDPVKSRNAPKVGFREALRTLVAVAEHDAGEALRLAAAGRDFMDGVTWSLHVTVEGSGTAAVAAALAAVRAAVGSGAREIPHLLPLALAARPFSVRGFLGPEGERWIASNGVFSQDRAVAAAIALEDFFAARREAMAAHGVWHSYLIQFPPGYVLLEPSYYWKDSVSPLHLQHLDAESARRFATLPADPAARAFAIALRAELKATLDALGAAHLQIGRGYAYAERLDPAARRTLQALKRTLDPDGVMNPGVLGLD